MRDIGNYTMVRYTYYSNPVMQLVLKIIWPWQPFEVWNLLDVIEASTQFAILNVIFLPHKPNLNSIFTWREKRQCALNRGLHQYFSLWPVH